MSDTDSEPASDASSEPASDASSEPSSEPPPVEIKNATYVARPHIYNTKKQPSISQNKRHDIMGIVPTIPISSR